MNGSPSIRRQRQRSGVPVLALQITGALAFLAAWQWLGSSQPFFYSSPIRVALTLKEMFAQEGLLLTTLESMWALVLGMVIAFAMGVTSGYLIGRYRVIRVMFEPYLAAFYAVPRVAFVPVMAIWFGIDREFVVASVVIGCAVVLTFSTAAGVQESMKSFHEPAIAFRISGWRLLVKVLLPGSVPFIASGMRLAVERGFVAVIVAEFLVGVPGVGFVIRTARASFDADRLFAMAVLLMILGVALIELTKAVETRLSRWRPQAF